MDLSVIVCGFADHSLNVNSSDTAAFAKTGYATGAPPASPPPCDRQPMKARPGQIASPPSSESGSPPPEPLSPVCLGESFSTESVAQAALASRAKALGELNSASLFGIGKQRATTCMAAAAAAAQAAAAQEAQAAAVSQGQHAAAEKNAAPLSNGSGQTKKIPVLDLRSALSLPPIQHLQSPACSEVDRMDSFAARHTHSRSLSQLPAPASAFACAALAPAAPAATAPAAAPASAVETAPRISFPSDSSAGSEEAPRMACRENTTKAPSRPSPVVQNCEVSTQPVPPLPVQFSVPVAVMSRPPYQMYQVGVQNGYPVALPAPPMMAQMVGQSPLELSRSTFEAANALCYQRTHPIHSCTPMQHQSMMGQPQQAHQLLPLHPQQQHQQQHQQQKQQSQQCLPPLPPAQQQQQQQQQQHARAPSTTVAIPPVQPQAQTERGGDVGVRKDISDVEAQRRGLRVHSCKTCGRSFGRKSGLIRHERIHLGIRPNVCGMCKKSFLQRSALTVHLRVHTGEKPYSCMQCHRQFSDSSSLARHRRIHLRESASASAAAALAVKPASATATVAPNSNTGAGAY